MVERIAPLQAMGYRVEPLHRDASKRLFLAWCETFLGAVKLRTGRYRHGGYHWHAFSYELVEAVEQQKASRTICACNRKRSW